MNGTTSVVRVYLDTNIIIAMFEGSGELSRQLINLVGGVGPRETRFFFTSELSLAETLAQPYRTGNEELITRYDNFLQTNGMIEVGPLDRDVLYYAAVIRGAHPGLRLPDAIHLSAAIGAQCSHFLTANMDFKGTYSITHTRYGLTRGPVQVSVLRPEAATLNELTRLSHDDR